MSRVNVEAVKSTRNAVRRQFYLLFIHGVVWRSVPFQWHITPIVWCRNLFLQIIHYTKCYQFYGFKKDER